MGVSPDSGVSAGRGVSSSLGVGSGGVSKGTEYIHNYLLLSDLNDSASSDTMTLARASSKTFIPDSGTLTTVTSNNAAFTGSGILIEPSHTNLFTYSQQFDNAAWTKLSATIGANTSDTTDPLGTNTADKVTASATGFVRVGQTVTSASDTVAVSCFMKAGTKNWINMRCGNPAFTNFVDVYFDLSDGSTGTVTEAGAATSLGYGTVSVGNGWYYCYSIVDGFVGTSCETRLFMNDADGGPNTVTSGGTVYLWQADIVDGSANYSPVVTTASSATSLKDDYTMSLDQIPANDFYIEFDWTPLSDADGYLFSFSNASDGIILFYDESASELKATNIGEGSATLSAFNPAVGTTYKVKVEKSSAAGMSLEVVGVSSTTNSLLTANVAWPAEGNVGSLYNDTGHSHSVIANLKVGDA